MKHLKKLKKFKKVHVPEVVDDDLGLIDEVPDNTPTVSQQRIPALAPEGVKLLDSLEKAGFSGIAAKLRELQVTEGVAALDPFVERIGKIEKQVDLILAHGHPIDVDELKSLLAVATDAMQARAKALLLPYGTFSPRTAIQSRAGNSPIQIGIGIGSGVVPRAKS